MHFNSLEFILVVAFVTTSISFTICVTGIFLWLRTLISKLGSKFEELIHCPWCFGHYVALIILLLSNHTRSKLLFNSVFLDFFVYWFCIMTIVGILHYVLLRTYAPIAEAEMFRKMHKK